MENAVALIRCADYEADRVVSAVRQAVDLLGGMECFVQDGQRVLIKPNLVQASDPAQAIVTHPAVVRAVVLLVQEAGGKVVIADNPFVPPLTQRGWQHLYEQTGLAAVAAETGAELNTHIVAEQRSHPEGKLLRLVDTSRLVSEVQVVISVPKLKTHSLMRFTGAVKNLFGTVPGTTKAGYHVKLQTVDRFAEMLLDLVSLIRPALTVMDAVVGMDGPGPSAGDPFPIGVVLASAAPVALDVAALALVGQNPASVPTVAAAVKRGWTRGRVADLALLGHDLAELQVAGFRLPPGGRSAMDRIPGFLQRWATRQLVSSPVITERCAGCGICIEQCPVETIAQVAGRAQIGLEDCIRCYCCHEGCPEQAITLHRPWLGQVLGWLSR